MVTGENTISIQNSQYLTEQFQQNSFLLVYKELEINLPSWEGREGFNNKETIVEIEMSMLSFK